MKWSRMSRALCASLLALLAAGCSSPTALECRWVVTSWLDKEKVETLPNGKTVTVVTSLPFDSLYHCTPPQ